MKDTKSENNVNWHGMSVTKESRALRTRQKPAVIWFTGLSGSGKSTSANALEKALFQMGHNTYLLDGDNIRHGLCKDLGFGDSDREENIRRVAEVAKLMVDAGLLVLTSFISPFKRDRHLARELLDEGEFIEVFVNTSLVECEKRDPKGLYRRARSGQISNFTGIDSPYERPESPEIEIDTEKYNVDEIVNILIQHLRKYKIIESCA